MQRNQRLLFYEESLDNQLQARRDRATSLVDAISKDQFLISSDDQLVAYVEVQLRVDPVELHEDARSMQQDECQVDVSRDPNRFWPGEQRGPFYVPGTRVIIKIPFSGEGWIFRYRTNPYWTVFPRADVNEARSGRLGEVVITIELPDNTSQQEFKRTFEEQIQLIRQFLGNAKKQVDTYNQQLPSIIQPAIRNRRQRLEQHKGITDLLGIPLETKPGVPSLEPVRVAVRSLPTLPTPPKTGLQPEPGITADTYERILDVIRHEVRTFETAPRTFAKFDEEELRDVILAHLNGHFQGAAAGEVFRQNGKTDICIQEKNRAAFVGECKVWQGAAQIPSALDQLLGYLTWRDSKAALIIFNKTVAEFSSILENLPKAISQYRCFIRSLGSNNPGEWRVVMRSIEDEGRLVTIHVFAVNIFTNTKVSAGTKAKSTL